VLELLITLLLAAHLLATNVAGAAPLVCIWLHRREMRGGDAVAGNVGRRLAADAITLFAVGMLLGVALLGVLWVQGDSRYLHALAQVPLRKYWFALAELVFSLACMGGYLFLWERARNQPNWHALLGVLAASNTLYHFPPLMIVLSVVSVRIELSQLVLDAPAFRKLLVEPEVISRAAHVWLASLAVSGIAVMGLSLRPGKLAEHAVAAARVAAGGARLALVATLLQLPLGIWVLLTLEGPARNNLMGEDLLGTGLLLISILASLGLMHALATVALGEVSRQSIVRCMLLLVLVVGLMTGVLRRIRHGEAPSPKAAVNSKSGVAEVARLWRTGEHPNSGEFGYPLFELRSPNLAGNRPCRLKS
jgi:hypothetical protein